MFVEGRDSTITSNWSALQRHGLLVDESSTMVITREPCSQLLLHRGGECLNLDWQDEQDGLDENTREER